MTCLGQGGLGFYSRKKKPSIFEIDNQAAVLSPLVSYFFIAHFVISVFPPVGEVFYEIF